MELNFIFGFISFMNYMCAVVFKHISVPIPCLIYSITSACIMDCMYFLMLCYIKRSLYLSLCQCIHHRVLYISVFCRDHCLCNCVHIYSVFAFLVNYILNFMVYLYVTIRTCMFFRYFFSTVYCFFLFAVLVRGLLQ